MQYLTITPPPFAGSRQRATEFASSLPDDLSDTEVTVDASNMQAWAQGFIDELTKQIAEIRHAHTVVFLNPNHHLKVRAESSAKIRGLSANFIFRDTP